MRLFPIINKQFKLQVKLQVNELSLVTLVTGHYYCKLRPVKNSYSLLPNPDFKAETCHKRVENHCVFWNQSVSFTILISVNPQNGILKPCFVRLSVRKEAKGGLAAEKVGFVDLDFANIWTKQLVENRQTSRHCLLNGYNKKKRLDNSILKIVVEMKLLSCKPYYNLYSLYHFIVPIICHNKKLGSSTETPVEVDGSLIDSCSSVYGSVRSSVCYPSRLSIIDLGSIGYGSLWSYFFGSNRSINSYNATLDDSTLDDSTLDDSTLDYLDSHVSTPGSGYLRVQDHIVNTCVDNEAIVDKLMADQGLTTTPVQMYSSVNSSLQLSLEMESSLGG